LGEGVDAMYFSVLAHLVLDVVGFHSDLPSVCRVL
jgi:hypothetical protein